MEGMSTLQKYPFVCWICLRPEDDGTMIPLDTEQECFEGTIRNYLAMMTAAVDHDKRHLFPRSICAACQKSLESYARFRSKVRTVHALLCGLVELHQHANADPIRELFRNNGTTGLLSAELKSVEDLIGKFGGFEIASFPRSMVNSICVEKAVVKEEVDEEEGNDMLYVVEYLPEVMVEVKEEQEAVFEGFDYEELLEEVDVKPEPKSRKRERKKDPDGEGKQNKTKPEESLQCPKCPYKARYSYLMRKHEQSHENRAHRCRSCKESFPTYSALSIHHEVKHRSWFCELCGKQFVHRPALRDHMVRAHGDGESKFSCEYCQARFTLIADLRIHVRNMHRPSKKVYKCETCGKEFRFNHLLVNHRLWHGDEYNFPCTQCDKKFKNKHALGKHTVKVHKERLYQCEHCTRPFATRGSLLDHIEHVHEIQMRYVCDICLAVFENPEILATHKSRHDHPKFLECGQCLSVLPTKEQLQDHLCITYRQDYICCGRDLVSYQQYNRHQLINHSIKMNARVKPIPGVLLGRLRATRKRVETCPKCKAIFDTKKLRNEHAKECGGKAANAS